MIPWKPSLLLPPLLLPLLIGNPAHALQIVDAQDGQTVLGKVSRKEITRIAFERGRVRKVTGNAGEFVLEKDDEKGQIFVRPTDPQSTKPINLFLTSDRGTVALLLQPVDTPSDTIMIREPRERSTGPTRVEASGRHVRTLKNLLLALADDALPDDMQALEPARDVALWSGTRLTLQRVLLGTGVVGEKYQLTNVADTTMEIAETALFKSGVMAVSVERPSLRPGEATNVFVIRERRSDD
ncbi:type-F conjugative transfer system secretin TraK [Candidatus Skiveiella danica]|uniref:type-F conjugative transfer system secretin TraK n=1 Tax=Candidatus Skiveiella danica TaxID=3386177 RepID=UPI0009CAA1FD|nr:MAG: TraK protein [Alphaproteobacteria bacterium ADurb.Bin100]